MKSLIHTNPVTKQTRWCIANIVANVSVEQYINVVDLGFRDDESHKPENFQWVDQPEGVSKHTHQYKDGEFVERVEEPVVVEPVVVE